MPRQNVNVIQSTFIRGLITESTGIKFPEDACTETWNCVFDETGRVTRRKGIDYETDDTNADLTEETNAVYTEFLWESVAGDGNTSFLVIQRGSTVQFFDVSSGSETVSTELLPFSIDLNLFIPSGSSEDPALSPCKYGSGAGYLVIVNPAAEPVVVEYDSENETISAEAVDIRIRDFVGLDDGLELTERVTNSESGIKTSNPRLYYNLANQGWKLTDALSQWDTARSDLPSNADIPSIFRASEIDAWHDVITARNAGNTPAPKGHFILNPFAPSRTTALTDDGITGVTVTDTVTAISYSGSTVIGDATNKSNAFDANNATEATLTHGQYAGVTLGSGSVILRAEVTSDTMVGSLSLYGKVGSAPANATDGTLLGTSAVFNTTSVVTFGVESSDTTTAYDNYWVVYNATSGFVPCTIQEVVLYKRDSTGTEKILTYKRPSATAFFAGRVFYAGVDGLALNNTVFFSQIIRTKDQIGKCYQKQDPTSEDFFDLLADDGGTVLIPEIATIIHLEAYQSSLIVFATNGVWEISGSSKNLFTANDYSVRKISGIGTNSRVSFIRYRGLPVWWGDSGIYALSFDPQYGSFSVQSLSDQTVFSFIDNIPSLNRNYVKGVYDTRNDIAIFLYNDSTNLTQADYYKYTKALCFNGLSRAFYPWSFESFTGTPDIQGIVFVQDPLRSDEPRVKLVVTETAAGTTSLTFAEFNDQTNWRDWFSLDNSGEDGAEYSSYFITGYMLHGQTQRFAQSNYVFVFLEQETGAGCLMQGIFDWTTSSASNKWSSQQQIYNSSLTNRQVNFRRLKVRGKGRSIQLRFESEDTKPFTIIGWSIKESINADI